MQKYPMDMTVEELVELRASIEAYLMRLISQARTDGDTWATIAGRLGVTPQEAHRRYSWMEKTNRMIPPDDARI